MKNIGIGIILLIGAFGVILISMLAFILGSPPPPFLRNLINCYGFNIQNKAMA
jgi:hypothetical protein